MPNNFVLNEKQLRSIDTTIRTPNQQQLSARKYIKAHKVDDYAPEHTWYYQETFGKAIRATNRQTDIPVVDNRLKSETVPVIEFTTGFDYSFTEAAQARKTGYDLMTAQANAVKRALAEFENRLLFNGMDITQSGANPIGLTTDPAKAGYQTSASPIKFDSATGEDDAQKLRNWLQDAVSLVTELPGFSGAKPLLLLPQNKINYLDRPYNKYNPDTTAYSMVSRFFRSIDPVPELSGKYNGTGEDMGIILVNTPDVVEFVDAQHPTALPPVMQLGGVVKQQYQQRTGGLILYQPEAIVQLTNI